MPVAERLRHRERLIQGMILVAARRGYAAASVARVIEQAGVSRATFYEHFADREACFLAAFGSVAERVELSLACIVGDRAPARLGEDLFDVLLLSVVRAPAEARLVLIEAQAGGPRARRAYEQLMAAVEGAVESCLVACREEGRQLAISARAIVDGVVGILMMRVFRGETAQLAGLRNDLSEWFDSYAAPLERQIELSALRRLGIGLVPERLPGRRAPHFAKLPRGRNAAAPEEVAARHRERILAAVAQLARTRGYAAMTVADIVKAGAVTREAFYEQFRSKEDAFLAVQSASLEVSVSKSAAGFFAEESWPVRVWNGLERLLDFIATHPDLAYVDVIESYAAGPAAVRRSFDNRMAYTLFLQEGYRQSPEAARLPRICSEAIASAILGLLRRQIDEDRVEQILEALPEAAYVALAPFLGPAAAIDLVEAKATGAAVAMG